MKIMICKLTKLHEDLVNWSAKNYPPCDGMTVSNNPPGIAFKSLQQAKEFVHFIDWDYQVNSVMQAFVNKKINKQRYESVIQESSQLTSNVEKFIKSSK